jgi:hypothetical protein
MPIRSPAEFLAQAMETTDVPNTDGTYVLDETIQFQNGDMNQVVKMLQGLSNEVALLRDQVRAGSNGHDSIGDRAEKLWRTDARPICIDGTVRSAMHVLPATVHSDDRLCYTSYETMDVELLSFSNAKVFAHGCRSQG